MCVTIHNVSHTLTYAMPPHHKNNFFPQVGKTVMETERMVFRKKEKKDT